MTYTSPSPVAADGQLQRLVQFSRLRFSRRLIQNGEVLIYNGMDELSQVFARALFSTFPNWERFLKTVNDDKTGAHYIEVVVPQEGTDRLLHLSTVDHEITIAFEQWHTHLGTFLGIDTAESVATAITIVESFVTEQAVVRISHRDGVWIESSLEYHAAPSEPKPNYKTQVFSWRRTYDETIETPSP